MPAFSLEVAGRVFGDWTSARLQRSLDDISGSFELEYDDQLRMQAVIPRSEARMGLTLIKPLQPARIRLDGELVMDGWIDDVDWELSGTDLRARIVGRDRTSFLIDCAASPEGPAEYKGLNALQIAQRVCGPFGVPVRADVDVGAPLRDFGVDLGETAMSVIDKATKQRGILVTSDGVGGLLMTRSGTRRAPAPLSSPGNAVSVGASLSSRERYSDYWVKGQTRVDRRGHDAALDGEDAPGTDRGDDGEATEAHSRRPVASPGPVDGAASPEVIDLPTLEVTAPRVTTQRQHASIVSTGHAVDPAITVYRPRVFSVRSQSGGAPNQLLAEWRMRIARGRSVKQRWTVAGWRDGRDDRLWRPNELVSIVAGEADPFDELVAAVTYSQSDREGSRTEIETVGREAYDLEPLPDQHRRHGAARGSNVARTGRSS